MLIQKPPLRHLCTEEQAGVFTVLLSRTFPFCSDSKWGEVVGVNVHSQTDPSLPLLGKAPFHSELQLAPSAAWRTATAAAVSGLPQALRWPSAWVRGTTGGCRCEFTHLPACPSLPDPLSALRVGLIHAFTAKMKQLHTPVARTQGQWKRDFFHHCWGGPKTSSQLRDNRQVSSHLTEKKPTKIAY